MLKGLILETKLENDSLRLKVVFKQNLPNGHVLHKEFECRVS